MPLYITKNLAIDDYELIKFVVECDSMKEAIRLFKCYHITDFNHWKIKGITQDLIKVYDYGKVKDFTYIE